MNLKGYETYSKRSALLTRSACGFLGLFLLPLHSGILTAQSKDQPIAVTISVKPGDSPTTLEPKRGGMVPIAILSKREFDATRADPATIKAGATGSEASIFRSASEDVDKDGHLDLLLLFRLPDLKLQCSDVEIRVTGKTSTGEKFEGKQKLVLAGC
jgi:hypothetical protein